MGSSTRPRPDLKQASPRGRGTASLPSNAEPHELRWRAAQLSSLARKLERRADEIERASSRATGHLRRDDYLPEAEERECANDPGLSRLELWERYRPEQFWSQDQATRFGIETLDELPERKEDRELLQMQFRKSTKGLFQEILAHVMKRMPIPKEINTKQENQERNFSTISTILDKTELEPEENQIETISDEDWSFQDEKNLRESGKIKIIVYMCQISNYLVIIRKSEENGDSSKQEAKYEEYTMYVFEDKKLEPIFSYVIAKGCIPLTLDGVIFINENQGNREELQVLMTVIDNNQNGKKCLQYVLVVLKKFKNMMYSSASPPGSPNLLRVRNLRNGDFDLLFNVGQTKFVYLRYPKTQVEWYNTIRDHHIMHSLYPPGDVLTRECVDFRHEVYSEDENNSSVVFLVRADSFYTLIFLNLEIDKPTGKWKFSSPLRTIEDVISYNTIYSSLIWDSQQKIVTMVGINFKKQSDAVKTRLHFSSMVLATKAGCDGTNNDTTLDPSCTLLHDSAGTNYETVDMYAPLKYTEEALAEELKNENPVDADVFIENWLERLQIRSLTELMASPDDQTLSTASLLAVGAEHVLFRWLLGHRRRPVLQLLDLQNSAFVDEAEGRRTVITGVAPLGDRPLKEGRVSQFILSASKGMISQMSIMQPLIEHRMTADKFLDQSLK